MLSEPRPAGRLEAGEWPEAWQGSGQRAEARTGQDMGEGGDLGLWGSRKGPLLGTSSMPGGQDGTSGHEVPFYIHS